MAQQEVNQFRVVPQPFQEDFLFSTARFPAYMAAWGTGKTLMMITKGIMLSKMYHSNLGMIVRKTETSLRKSTIRDFEDYTRIKVPQTTGEVTIPGTGSKILFTHADDLRTLGDMLQNINLGWAGIEQAEEMQTAEVFDMIRGRLRRVLTPSQEIQGSLVKLGVMRKPVANFRILEGLNTQYGKWREGQIFLLDKIIKVLTEKLEQPYHQLFPIANAGGHNWLWHRWIYEKWKGYHVTQANSFQNRKHIRQIVLDDWARLKEENPRKYNQFVMNSHADYDMEGAFYASLMSDAMKTHRVGCENLFENTAPVYTWWDLGIRASDTTVIWFVQFIEKEIWLIDYYENYGEGMKHYAELLASKGYNYAEHFLPPDANTRLQHEELDTRHQILKRLRPRDRFRLVERHLISSRIETARGVIPRCRFSDKCRKGVEGLNSYKRKKNEIMSTDLRPVFMSEALHDWASNPADGFGYMAWTYRNQAISGCVYGYAGATPQWYEDDDAGSNGTTDLLGVA